MTGASTQGKFAASLAGALAFCAGSCLAQGVHFNPNPTAVPIVTTFDWSPGHVLYRDCFGQAGLGAASGCTIYAQGRLSATRDQADNVINLPPGVSFTFTLVTKAMSGTPGPYDGTTVRFDVLTFQDVSDASSQFVIYTNTPDNTNPLSGTGYDDGSPILKGTVRIVAFTLVNVGTSPVPWDQVGTNDYPGVTTLHVVGSPQFEIDVTWKDDAYFPDPMTMFTVGSSPDARHLESTTSPFYQTNPAAKVAGTSFNPATDSGADRVVDIYCGGAGAGPCSAEFQGDAATRFLTVP